jgi:hypothetical protein
MKRRLHALPKTTLHSEEDATSSVLAISGSNDSNECPTRTQARKEENMDTNTEPEKRLCKAPGCTTSLTPLNSSGYCSRHFHFSRRKSNRGDGQANKECVQGKNSSHDHSNAIYRAEAQIPGMVHDLREDRLNQLILGWSLELKTRLATDWLMGKL